MSFNYSLIFLLLNAKIRIEDQTIEKNCTKIYKRLLFTGVYNIIPVENIINLLDVLFKFIDNFDLSSEPDGIIIEIVKLCINNITRLNDFEIIEKLVETLSKKQIDNKKMHPIIILTLIQIMEKLFKVLIIYNSIRC